MVGKSRKFWARKPTIYISNILQLLNRNSYKTTRRRCRHHRVFYVCRRRTSSMFWVFDRRQMISLATTDMFFQIRRQSESDLAEPALIYAGAKQSVGFHVSRQLAGLSTGVGADHALVRFLSGVRPPVHGKVAAVAEHLSAELARVFTATLGCSAACGRRRKRTSVQPNARTSTFDRITVNTARSHT